MLLYLKKKRVTDRVKVFEAAAYNDQSSLKKQTTIKNGNQKKSSASFSSTNNKRDQQISPSSSSTTESVDTQSTNDSKPSTKNKSKRPSLKKQIQNLLKIDKPSTQDDSSIIEEQTSISNGKKANTLNSTRPKRDNGKTIKPTELLHLFSIFFN